MKIEFKVSLTRHETPYIKLSMKKGERNNRLMEDKISDIMYELKLKFTPGIDHSKSNISLSSKHSKICFYRGDNSHYLQIIQEMVSIITRQIPKNPYPLICDFLNQIGMSNFELYRTLLSSLEMHKPALYDFHLDQLISNSDSNLLNKLIIRENDRNKRSFYIFKSLNDTQRFYFILGYIRIGKENGNIDIPDVLQIMIITYAFNQKELKASFEFLKNQQRNINFKNTKGVRTFQHEEPKQDTENIDRSIMSQKNKCCIL